MRALLLLGIHFDEECILYSKYAAIRNFAHLLIVFCNSLLIVTIMCVFLFLLGVFLLEQNVSCSTGYLEFIYDLL